MEKRTGKARTPTDDQIGKEAKEKKKQSSGRRPGASLENGSVDLSRANKRKEKKGSLIETDRTGSKTLHTGAKVKKCGALEGRKSKNQAATAKARERDEGGKEKLSREGLRIHQTEGKGGGRVLNRIAIHRDELCTRKKSQCISLGRKFVLGADV